MHCGAAAGMQALCKPCESARAMQVWRRQRAAAAKPAPSRDGRRVYGRLWPFSPLRVDGGVDDAEHSAA